jgi:DNA-binding transcriptional LysR family regulator
MIEEIARFIHVTREGNVSKSAEKQFITQSALSQSIMRLEKTLGTKLFLRNGKNLELSPDGRTVLLLGEKIITLWEQMKNPVSRAIEIPNYNIGMFDNAALLSGKYFEKYKSSEKYRLELIIDTSGTLKKQLLLGLLDLAVFVDHPGALTDKNLLRIASYCDELIPVASGKFSGKAIPFILYNKTSYTRAQIDKVFIKNNFTPEIFAESTSVTFMKELALQGAGVALLPKNYIRYELQHKELVRQNLPFTINRNFSLYLNSKNVLDKNSYIVKDIRKALQKYEQPTLY